MIRRTRVIAPALVGVLGLTFAPACGSKGTSATTGTTGQGGADNVPTQSGEVAVSATDNNFDPETVKVTSGSKITWSNNGRNDHNVVPVEGDAFGVDVQNFKPGQTYAANFDTPGTFHYYCSIHGTKDRGMIGTIEVVAQ